MMGVIKRCGLFAVLFAVSATVLYGGSSVSAASYADTWISTSDELYVSNPSCNANERVDFTYNISDIFNESSYWSGVGGESTRQEFAENYSTSETSGAVFVMNDRGGAGVATDRRIIKFIYSNAGFILNWVGDRVTVATPVEADIYFFNVMRYADCSIRVNYATTTNNTGPADLRTVGGEANEQTPTWYDIFSAQGNIDLNLPSDYEGVPIPIGPPLSKAHKPNITWSVNDKNVIVYSDSTKNTAVLDDYQIYWFISNTSFDIVQPTEPFALSGCTPPDYNNNFTVPIHFDYGIQAYYADENCNILQIDDDGNSLAENMERLTIDGSTFDGSTTDHEAIIGEIEENAILKAIRQFRPNDGGLAGLIYAPIEAVATLPTIVGSCSPINLPLLGENIQLECIRPTIQASPMGPVYTTISVIITGIVTWWVAWRTFGIIKGIQDPQDDRVEVLKL